jgi:hypothetical protein
VPIPVGRESQGLLRVAFRRPKFTVGKRTQPMADIFSIRLR